MTHSRGGLLESHPLPGTLGIEAKGILAQVTSQRMGLPLHGARWHCDAAETPTNFLGEHLSPGRATGEL